LLDDFGILEDLAELSCEKIDLGGVQVEVCQRSNGRYLISRESRRHAKC
jgi:hypothetical protein